MPPGRSTEGLDVPAVLADATGLEMATGRAARTALAPRIPARVDAAAAGGSGSPSSANRTFAPTEEIKDVAGENTMGVVPGRGVAATEITASFPPPSGRTLIEGCGR